MGDKISRTIGGHDDGLGALTEKKMRCKARKPEGPQVTSDEKYLYRHDSCGGHHEVEIFRGEKGFEAAESTYKWKNCDKNPGHEKFISPIGFKSQQLSKVKDARHRKVFRSFIDLTVRLRVNRTSRERPDNDEFSQGRGTDSLRTGTGFIDHVYPRKINKPCPCGYKKQWRFEVLTAHHVVYNTEEARLTMVDLFLDDESCERDGRMKTVWGVKVSKCYPARYVCYMECVTCDEDVGERIESAWRCYDGVKKEEIVHLSGLDLPSSCDRDCYLGLIVSHPHGQPKKITWGKWRYINKDDRQIYTTPTCPGSSGAPVFTFYYIRDSGFQDIYLFYQPVHSGSYNKISTQHEDQLNYAFWDLRTF